MSIKEEKQKIDEEWTLFKKWYRGYLSVKVENILKYLICSVRF